MAATQEEVRELATRLQAARDVAEMQAQQIAELQSQAQRAQNEAAAGGAAGANPPPRGDHFGANRIVDTRVLGRPDYIDGTPGSWRDWSTTFRAYSAACEPRLEQLMRDVETKSVPQLAALLPENQREINAQLYYMLVMLTKQQSLDRVVSAGQGEGLEAWRLLTERYEPRLRQRRASYSSPRARLNMTWLAREPSWFRLPEMFV